MNKPVWTLQQITANLTRERIAWNGSLPIAYSFYEFAPAHLGKPPGFSAFSPAQREALREIYDLVSDIVPLTFYQVADNGQKPGASNQRMTYYNVDSSTVPFWGAASVDGTDPTPTQFGTIQSSEIIVNQFRAKVQGPWEPGDSNPRKLMHEVLHGLGIAHPGAYNGDSALNYENFAEYRQDTHEFTVMSYWLASNTGADHVAGGITRYASTPLLHDIAALQALYGANMTTRTGDTVYGFNATAGRDAYDLGLNPHLVFSIWDAGGIDTLDLSGFNTPSDMDLEQGGFTSAGEMTRQISIAFGAVIENGKGGGGNDTIRGNEAANRLEGGAGDDLLDGRTGADVLVGGAGNDVFLVDDAGDQAIEAAGGGTDEVRTTLLSYTAASHIERLKGIAAAGGQTLTGNDLDNVIEGGAGDDVITGNGGADILDGGAGADRFVYRAFTDSTSAATDVVRAFQSGIDKIDLTALGPVLVRWTETTGADGGIVTMLSAGGRTGNALIRIEGRIAAGDVLADRGIAGTDADDLLEGTAGADLFDGAGGNDVLTGRGGDDDLFGGDGVDTAVYAGNRADYDIQTGGKVTVRDLNAANGDEGTDSLDGVERLRFADMTVSLGTGPNNAPRLGQPAMADQVWADGEEASYRIPETSFIDLDGNETLTFRATLADGSALPDWLVFDAASRTLRGTPPVSAIGAALTVRVTVTDGFASVFDDLAIGVTQSPGADVVGTAGADLLEGTFRNETMIGLAGDDVLRGSAGADRLDGGADVDEADFSASPEGVTVNLVTGLGTGGHAEGDVLISIERVTGSAFADRIVAGADSNRIDGGAGADTMEGGDGGDVYIVDDAGDVVVELANAGTDEVRTGLAGYALAANVERLTGTSGAGQSLTGNALGNRIDGGAGNDVIDGGAGADRMSGGAGDDLYAVDHEGDTVVEEAGGGTDEVRTALAAWSISTTHVEILTGTSALGQALTGNALANVIQGGAGDDLLDGGTGADTLRGGQGNDAYVVDDAGDMVVEAAGEGTDEIRTALASYALTGLGNVENLTGTSASGQVLTGNALDNVVTGGAGGDILDGGPGGNDTLRGGAGDDTYRVDAGDIVVEAAGEGTDEVLTAAAAFSLAGMANVEKLTGTSNGGQALTGNDGSNIVTGGGANDVLDGGGGADFLEGRGGDDLYLVDDPADQAIETANNGTDEVRSSAASFTLGAHLENLTGLLSTGQILAGNDLANWIIGGGGDDAIYGGAGDDVFNAGAGNDYMDGGTGVDAMGGFGGNDVYVVDEAADRVVEAENEGTDEIRTALASYSLEALIHVENLTGTSATGQVLTGNAANNILFGGMGDDTLIAGAGNDILIGFGGSDVLRGQAGDDVYIIDAGDTVVELAGDGIDEVRTQAEIFVLTGAIENLRANSDIGHDFRGNELNNVIVGAAGNDVFRAQDGGGDLLFGLGGVDSFYMGGAFDNGDLIDGGDNRDSLILQGNYAGLTLTWNITGGSSIANIEGISLLSGSVTHFGQSGTNLYSYNLTLVDGNIAAGALMKINGFNLQAGENFTLNASAETDAPLQVFAGFGVDNLTGGQQGDAFIFGHDGRLGAGDRVDGGGGYDVVYLRGDYTLDFNAAGFETAFTNVESLAILTSANSEFAGGGDGDFDYTITWADALLAAGATFTVNASRLQAHETFVFDGSRETDGVLRVFGGASADTLTGGGSSTQLHGGGGADVLNGGAGVDLFRYSNVGDSNAAATDTVLGFVAGTDKIDVGRVDAKASTADLNEAFIFIGSDAFAAAGPNEPGQLRTYNVSGDLWRVEGDVNGDGIADLVIDVHVEAGQPLTAGDFIV
jgi:Ca2+-binding RTX toxin-like protein